MLFFFFSSRRRHTRYWRDWSSDVCSSDLEVERALPQVVVRDPQEVPDALGWPEFDPGPVTAAAASRLASYRQRESRRAARAQFAGTEEDFLRWCALRATLRPAMPADADRLAELARRTTQYNSTGAGLPA